MASTSAQRRARTRFTSGDFVDPWNSFYVQDTGQRRLKHFLKAQIERHGSVEVFYASPDMSEPPLDDDESSAEPVRAYSNRKASVSMVDAEEFDDDDIPLKGKNANLSNRLPREDFAVIVPFDDRPPLMERCKEVLGDRMGENRLGFLLDGKPANTEKVVRAAGLKFADEETLARSPPTRRPKRRRKL